MTSKPKNPSAAKKGGAGKQSKIPPGARAMAALGTGGNVVPIGVRLPAAYLRILGTEAALLGLRRNALLSALIRRKLGRMKLERSDDAPDYTISDAELEEYKQYTWHCPPMIRTLVEEDMQQMGITSYSTWINVTLNEWIGRPGGLRSTAWRRQ